MTHHWPNPYDEPREEHSIIAAWRRKQFRWPFLLHGTSVSPQAAPARESERVPASPSANPLALHSHDGGNQ